MTTRRSTSRADLLAVYAAGSGACGICGDPVDPDDACVDHVLPLARGGSDERGNLQLAHRFCNTVKRHHTVEEYDYLAIRDARRAALLKPKRIMPEPQERMQTIRQLREARGWTQAQLAERIGTSAVMVSQWETDYRGLSAVMLRKLAHALDASMDDIALPTVPNRKHDDA